MQSHLNPSSPNQEAIQQPASPATLLPPNDHPPTRQENYSGTNVQAAFNRYSKNIIELLETLSKHDEINLLEKNHKNEIFSIKEHIHSWSFDFSTFSDILEDLNPKDPVNIQNALDQFIQEKYKTIYLEFKSIHSTLNKLIANLKQIESQTSRARSGSSGKAINQILSVFSKNSANEQQALPDILNKLVIEFGRINGLANALFGTKHPFIKTDYETPTLNLSYHPFLKKLQDQSNPLLTQNKPGQELLQIHLGKFVEYLKSGVELNQAPVQSILKAFLSWFFKPTKQQAQQLIEQIQSFFNSKSLTTSSNQNAADPNEKISFEKLTQDINYLTYIYLMTPLAYLEQTQIGNSINAFTKHYFKTDMSPIALWHASINLLKEIKPLIRQNELQEVIKRLDAIRPEIFEVSAAMALADTIPSYQTFSYPIPTTTENENKKESQDKIENKPINLATPLKLNSTLYHLHIIISTILYHTNTTDLFYNKHVSGDILHLSVEHALTMPLSHTEMEALTPSLKYMEFLILSNLNSNDSENDKFKKLQEKFQEEIIKIKSLPIKNINTLLACFERLLPSITFPEQSNNSTQFIQPHFFIDYSLTENKAKTKIFVHHLALIESKLRKYLDLEAQKNTSTTTNETLKVSQLKTNGILTAQKILSEINLFKIEISHSSHCDLTSWIEKVHSILNGNTTLNNPFSDLPVSVKLDNNLKLIYKDIKQFCKNLETGMFEMPQALNSNRSRSGSASLSTSSNSFLSNTTSTSTTTLSSVPEISTEPKIENATEPKIESATTSPQESENKPKM